MKHRFTAGVSLLALTLGIGPAWANVSGPAGPVTTGGDVTLDATGTGTTTVGDSGGDGTLQVNTSYTTGTLVVAPSTNDAGSSVSIVPFATLNDDATVGDAGIGSFTNTNGTHNVTGNLILGNQSTGNGTYTITGDNAQTTVNFAGNAGNPPPETPNGALIVGNYGNGTFVQGGAGDTTGPTVNVAGDLSVGLQSGGKGTYTINDGALTVNGALYVGQASTANNQFIQNGGSVNITGNNGGDTRYTPLNLGVPPSNNAGQLVIGGDTISNNGTGTYTIYDGPTNSPSTLSANSITLGYSGTGTFNQNGGAVTTYYIDMGDCGGCNGSSAAGFYNLTGDGQLTVNGNVHVGDFGYAYFTQNGAATTNTISGTLSIGNGATATPLSPAYPNPPGPNLTGPYNRSGTYELDAGTLSTQYTVVGAQGTGYFLQTGGAHNVQYTLTIGQQNSQPMSGPAGTGTVSNPVFGGPAPGVYNMSSGTLTAGGDTTGNADTGNAGIIVGDAGNGTFNQTGGSVTSGTANMNRGDVIISAQAGSTGVYNIGLTGQASAPALQIYGDAVLGRDGAGSVTVPDGMNDGGTVTVPLAASNGTLAIAGNGTTVSINQYTGFDSHNGGNLQVGVNGTGAVTQADQSTVYLDHNLVLGANSGSTGSYTLSATSIGGSSPPAGSASSSYNLFVGSDLNVGGMQTDAYNSNFQTTLNGGSGTFTLNSGDAYVVGNVNVGNNDGTGTLAVTGGTLTAGVGMNVGYNNNYGNGGGTGTVTQSGGTVTVGNAMTGNAYNALSIGNTATSSDPVTGAYTITGSSTLNVYSNADVGVSPGGTGTLTIGTLGGSDSPTVNILSTGNGDGFLTVGDGGTGTLTMNTGALNAVGLAVGVNGTGTVNHNGGTVTVAFVDISTPVGGGSGAYNVNGSGAELDAQYINVGGGTFGTAAFNQFDGTVNATGGLIVTDSQTTNVASSNYKLAGGTLNTLSTFVGYGGAGSFTQSNGIHNVQTSLVIGYKRGDNGLYTMSGGTLNTETNATNPNNPFNLGDKIGYYGTGEFDQSGGTVNSQSIYGVTIGWASNGTYKLTGTGILNVAGNLNVGGFGAGTFIQGDGQGTTSNTVSGFLAVGGGGLGAPPSSYTLNDGTLTVSGSEIVGYGAQGTFTQTGGTNNANGGLTVGLLANPSDSTQFGAGTYNLGGNGALNVGGDLILGSTAGTTGVFNYNVSTGDAGSLTFTGMGENLVVGDAGTGTLYIGSSTNTTDLNLQASKTQLDVGRSLGGYGTVNLAAGSSLEDSVIVGDAGTGVFNNAGGTHTVSGDLLIGNQSTGNGTYNLTAGGSLSVSGFTFVGVSGQGTFTNDASTHNTNILVVAGGTGSKGLYTLDGGGSLTVGASGAVGFADIGEQGSGTFTQTANGGNTTTVYGALDIGRYAGGIGTVNLNGGSIEVAQGFAVVGDAGTGYVNQSGGTFTVDSGGLAIGRGESLATNAPVTGTGTYSLSGGKLAVTGGIGLGSQSGNYGYFVQTGGAVKTDTEYVGLAGVGDWNQSAGTNTASSLVIGNNSGGTGTYELSGASTLNGGSEYVGAGGNGTLSQSGGTNNATYLSIANNAGGTGLYTLSGGSLSNTGDTFLGGDTGANGMFTQNGGTASLGGNVNVGYAAGSTGTLTLGGAAGTSLSIRGNLTVGVLANSTGTVNFNTATGDAATLSFLTPGELLTVGASGSGSFNEGGGDLNLLGSGITLDIGQSVGSSGAYTLSGGTLETAALNVGDAGYGTFLNSGGTHTVTGNLVVGNQTTGQGFYTLGGKGSLTLDGVGSQIVLGNTAPANANSGGTFNFNTAPGDMATLKFNATGQSLIVGLNGKGAFYQGGGDVNLVPNSVGLDIAANKGSNGYYDLSGAGTLETSGGLKVGDDGTGQFNISGTAVATVNGDLTVASQKDAFGQLNVFGGALNVTGGLTVGDAGRGQYNQNAGAATVGGNLMVGNQANAIGSYVQVDGGTLTVDGGAQIGNGVYGSFGMDGGSVDIKGSLTFGALGAALGGGAIEGGSLTVGDGGTGNTLLINAGSGVKIEDIGGLGALVTVDGDLVNNGELALGLHTGLSSPSTLTVNTGTFTNNGSFNFEGQSVLNATVVNNGSFSAKGGGANVALNGNLDNFNSVNVSSLGGAAATLTQTGNFTNEANATLTVVGSNLTINGTGAALDNKGTVNISQDVNGPTAPISVVKITGAVKNESTGSISITDSKVTVTGSLDNANTINITRDAGKVNVASNVTVTGTLTNETGAKLTVSNGSTISVGGAALNNGTINIQNSTANWNGGLTNNGAYNSDPGSLNVFTDLNNGPNGYLTASAGDIFKVTGNFNSTSTQATLWSTTAATLEFSTGTSTSHTLQLTGQELGAIAAGLTNNFAWGTLQIDAGNSLTLVGTVGKNALYLDSVLGLDFSSSNPLDITNIIGDGLNIYYDPNVDTALNDKVYNLADGGQLDPFGSVTTGVPEPSTWALMLLGFSGLVTMAGLKRRRDARTAASQAS